MTDVKGVVLQEETWMLVIQCKCQKGTNDVLVQWYFNLRPNRPPLVLVA